MKCADKDIKELFPLYLEQALDDAGKKRVEQHLEGCVDCREELVLLRAMAAEPVPDPGEAFWSRMPAQVYRQVREQAETARNRPRFGILQGLLMPRWAWVPAAVLVIAALAWLTARPFPEAVTIAGQAPAASWEEELLSDEAADIASLSADELAGAGSWAEEEMKALAAEAGQELRNGKDANIYEELAELDGKSLERLSRMLDQLKKGGQV